MMQMVWIQTNSHDGSQHALETCEVPRPIEQNDEWSESQKS